MTSLPKKWVDQTRFGGQEGNCLPACVASIFGLALDAVPNVCADGNTAWLADLRAWSIERLGFAVARWQLSASRLPVADASEMLDGLLPGVYTIVSGKAPRGLDHATVWCGGRLVHDPHPSRAGLLDVLDLLVFVPCDPCPQGETA